MRASNSRSITRSAASSPPSRNSAPHTASSASARIDCRRNPPVLSSPEPSCRASPRPSPAATSASGSLLTTRARNRLRSPSEASGNMRYRWRAMTRLSTASPRNSSRSLLGPGALRWVRAAPNSPGSRGSWPRRSRTQRTGDSFTLSLGASASDAHGLVEDHEDREVGEQRRLVVVGRLHHPRLAVAGDLDVLRRRVIDALDVKTLLDRAADRLRVGAFAGAEVDRHLL